MSIELSIGASYLFVSIGWVVAVTVGVVIAAVLGTLLAIARS